MIPFISSFSKRKNQFDRDWLWIMIIFSWSNLQSWSPPLSLICTTATTQDNGGDIRTSRVVSARRSKKKKKEKEGGCFDFFDFFDFCDFCDFSHPGSGSKVWDPGNTGATWKPGSSFFLLASSEVGAFSAVCGVVPLLAPADAVGDHLGNDLVFDFGVNDRLEAVLVKVDRPQAVQKLGIAGWWHQLGSHRKESQQGDSEEWMSQIAWLTVSTSPHKKRMGRSLNSAYLEEMKKRGRVGSLSYLFWPF